jgi:UDP-glucose 4-epimerase
VKVQGARVLVTGGLGFIGSHIVEALLRDGASVRILDNLRSGHEENIAAVRNDVEVLLGDILDRDALRHAMRDVDAVSHQAAQLEITRAIDDPVEDLTTNTIGTLNVFAVAAELGVQRIVQASSAGVYGQAVQVPEREDEHPTEPNWAYGVSKLANEKYAAIMGSVHGLEITSLRYGIVYGPREWYGRVLTLFLKRALDGEPLVVFGDGEQVRDFVFVEDVVAMHSACLRDDRAIHEVFNVSSGIGTSVNQLADLVLEVTGRGVEVIHEDLAEGAQSAHFERRRLPQELRTLVQSPAKAESLLGWRPTTDLAAGLAREREWLQQHRERWTVMSY